MLLCVVSSEERALSGSCRQHFPILSAPASDAGSKLFYRCGNLEKARNDFHPVGFIAQVLTMMGHMGVPSYPIACSLKMLVAANHILRLRVALFPTGAPLSSSPPSSSYNLLASGPAAFLAGSLAEIAPPVVAFLPGLGGDIPILQGSKNDRTNEHMGFSQSLALPKPDNKQADSNNTEQSVMHLSAYHSAINHAPGTSFQITQCLSAQCSTPMLWGLCPVVPSRVCAVVCFMMLHM